MIDFDKKEETDSLLYYLPEEIETKIMQESGTEIQMVTESNTQMLTLEEANIDVNQLVDQNQYIIEASSTKQYNFDIWHTIINDSTAIIESDPDKFIVNLKDIYDNNSLNLNHLPLLNKIKVEGNVYR